MPYEDQDNLAGIDARICNRLIDCPAYLPRQQRMHALILKVLGENLPISIHLVYSLNNQHCVGRFVTRRMSGILGCLRWTCAAVFVIDHIVQSSQWLLVEATLVICLIFAYVFSLAQNTTWHLFLTGASAQLLPKTVDVKFWLAGLSLGCDSFGSRSINET
jgi:hypothetical protein